MEYKIPKPKEEEKIERKSRLIWWLIILLVGIIVLVMSCNREVIVERNNTIYINRTIYLNNTIIINNTIPCNITCPEINTTYNRDYVLSLIRQLKHCEKQQNKYINNSDCFDDLNHTNTELEECKAELCNEWNSSWC